jgi:SAM-dependent methyltransferase
MSDRYFIRDGYRARSNPEYFDDVRDGVLYQPDVYPEAVRIAEALGATRLIDLGCGNGARIASFHPPFEVVGIDYGGNIDRCRSTWPFGDWRTHDLDAASESLPLSTEELKESVVICSDVIEHVVRPDVLLGKLRDCLKRGANAVVLSTPERNLWRGLDHLGPPPNRSHVREWALAELAALLRHEEFEEIAVFLTRSNNIETQQRTILALLFPDARRATSAPVPRSKQTFIWQTVLPRIRRWRHYQHQRLKRARARLRLRLSRVL